MADANVTVTIDARNLEEVKAEVEILRVTCDAHIAVIEELETALREARTHLENGFPASALATVDDALAGR